MHLHRAARPFDRSSTHHPLLIKFLDVSIDLLPYPADPTSRSFPPVLARLCYYLLYWPYPTTTLFQYEIVVVNMVGLFNCLKNPWVQL